LFTFALNPYTMNFDYWKWLHNLQSTGTKYFMLAGGAFLFFYILFPKAFSGIRIQKLFPKRKDHYRDVFFSFISMMIFATVAYVVFTTLRPYNHIQYGSISQYGVVWFWLSFVWMFFLHDAYFYWMHRLMHLPFLFKHVHLIHHKSTNPSPWTAYAFHPLEAVMEAGIVPLIAFTLPINRVAFTSFMIFQLSYNVYGHLGYEILQPIANTKIGRWLNTSTAHNMHHKYFKGNYGLYTRIWDRTLNTNREMDA